MTRVEKRYIAIQRILRRRNYGFQKVINSYTDEIVRATFTKKSTDELARKLYSDLTAGRKESLEDVFKPLNERMDKLFTKLSKIFSTLLLQGSRKVFSAKGSPLELRVPSYAKEIEALKNENMKLVKGVTDEQRAFLVRKVSDGIKQGKTYSAMADDILKETEFFTRNRAKLIAFNESHKAHTIAMEKTMVENGITKYQWLTAGDDRVSDICQSLHRQVFTFGKTGLMNWKDAKGKVVKIHKSPRPIRDSHIRCFDKETEVLTNEGWKYFKDLKGTEDIFSLNPETNECGWQGIKKQVSYLYEGDLLHFKNNYNFDIVVTPNHQIWYYNKKGKLKVSDAEDVAELGYFKFPRIAEWNSNKDKIIVEGKEYDGVKFCRFLAWYLSDGSCTKRESYYQASIHQESNREDLRNVLQDSGIGFYETKDKFYLRGKELKKWLYGLGKSKTKFIPKELKGLSKRCLTAFVKEYLKGDGNVQKPCNFGTEESWTFFTQSDKLASDFAELLIKIGYYASYYKEKGRVIKFKNGTYKCGDLWRIRKCSKQTVFNSYYGEVKPFPYNDYVYDVELNDWHILYVRRNGKCHFSGNCRCVTIAVTD